MVEEELELPLENGYTLFEEVHDSITLEPTYGESFTFLREVHVPTLMEPSFLEYMEKIQRAMCNIKGNFMSFLFYRKNVIELSEWLHESYLNNNEDIHKLTVQNEKLLESLQDTCSFSYILYFQILHHSS